MTPYDLRIARVIMSLSRGVDSPTLARIEALLGIVYDVTPAMRHEPPITVEVRVPWPDEREGKWMGQDSGIEE